jgi:hypothetical protein
MLAIDKPGRGRARAYGVLLALLPVLRQLRFERIAAARSMVFVDPPPRTVGSDRAGDRLARRAGWRFQPRSGQRARSGAPLHRPG